LLLGFDLYFQKLSPVYAVPNVIGFLKNRFRKHTDELSPEPALGKLEMRVMEIVWTLGQANVHEVNRRIDTPRAYTTVMTTLERLFKKGLLTREKSGRAFIYAPAVAREEWERRRAGNLVASFLNGPQPSRELLVSTLLDVVGEHDKNLLDELEKKIRLRRKELSAGGKS
jgi:predicted transcriptional regulator